VLGGVLGAEGHGLIRAQLALGLAARRRRRLCVGAMR
jgi:hypothetical protein